MRLAAKTAVLTASFLSLLLPPGGVAAAPGDLLETSRTNVNVRATPTTNAAIVATINSGEKIIEISVEGDWFQVDLPDQDTQGWIYGPLLNNFAGEPKEVLRPARQTKAASATSTSRIAALQTTATAYDSELTGDAARGEAIFAKCGSCHTTVPDVHAQGPSLVGIFGRPPATSSGFRYSGALQAFAGEGAVWDEATLDLFIQRPGRVVKGTSMPFSGLRDPQDRRDVIAFLQQLSR